MHSSKTTPGHDMRFETYIVEAICLNMNKKLKPYFWRVDVGGSYWKGKFQREISAGIKRLKQEIKPFPSGTQESLLVKAICHTEVKTLLNQKNVEKVRRRYAAELKYHTLKIEELSKDTTETIDHDEYMRQNAKQRSVPNKLLAEDETI